MRYGRGPPCAATSVGGSDADDLGAVHVAVDHLGAATPTQQVRDTAAAALVVGLVDDLDARSRRPASGGPRCHRRALMTRTS